MIDGVKIDCPNLNGSEWLSNKLLCFRASIDTQTGELLDSTQTAVHRGLVFIITKSKKYDDTFYCSVRGSLHKYWNNGKHNANDFTYNDLQSVLDELNQKFGINPKTAILRNLEFGVNVQLSITSTELFKNIVTSGKHNFSVLKVDGKTLGRCISKSQSIYKIYDKGKQYKTVEKNLIRFEVHVNKMQYLSRLEVVNLLDILNVKKLQRLAEMLINEWFEVVYYDKQIEYKQMTVFEQKKLLYYATPRNWNDFDRMQRMRAKKHFQKLIDKYGNGNPEHIAIGQIITKKCQQLIKNNCIRIYHDKTENVSKEMYTFLPLEYTVNMYTSEREKEILKKNQKKPLFSEQKKCVCCGVEISHKPKISKYCSKKCNNKINGMKRTENRRKLRLKELPVLTMLLQKIPIGKMWLCITYKENKTTYTDTLHQSEINAPPEWIKKITAITIKPNRKNGKPNLLTGSRAKKLIRIINKTNILHYGTNQN